MYYKNAVSNALDEQVQLVRDDVRKKLDEEFEDAKIQGLIEETAQDYTEGRVEHYISEKVEERISPFSREMKQLVIDYETDLIQLKKLTELEQKARFGSRDAYNELCEYEAETPDTDLRTTASICIDILQRELSIYRHMPSGIFGSDLMQDGKDISPQSRTTKELFDILEAPNIRDATRHALMHHIAKRPKDEVIPEALKILRDSDSLPACAATCGILSSMLGEKAGFMEFGEWIKVCEEQLGK